MSYLFQFDQDDIIHSTNEAHPRSEMIILSDGTKQCSWEPSERNADGYLTYGLSASSGQFVYKDSSNADSFPTASYGEQIQLNSGMTTASISLYKYWTGFDTSSYEQYLSAIKSTLKYNTLLSPHFAFSSSYGDKSAQEMLMISIPEAFYGSKIQKGSVKLSFLETEVLFGTLEDSNQNGELIQTFGATGSGLVAGVVLYDEGIILLTGSWIIDDSIDGLTYSGTYPTWNTDGKPRWCYWGADNTDESFPSYTLEFNGTVQTPVILMYAHAPKGSLNHSNNPSFVDRNDMTRYLNFASSSHGFYEDEKVGLTNSIYSEYNDVHKDFRKQTYISKVAVLDEDKNVIAIASLAEPLRKLQEREYTIKISIDG